MKIKEKFQNGWTKVKETVKSNKKKAIKAGAIVGGTALGLGALGLALSHRGEFDDESEFYDETDELIIEESDGDSEDISEEQSEEE